MADPSIFSCRFALLRGVESASKSNLNTLRHSLSLSSSPRFKAAPLSNNIFIFLTSATEGDYFSPPLCPWEARDQETRETLGETRDRGVKEEAREPETLRPISLVCDNIFSSQCLLCILLLVVVRLVTTPHRKTVFHFKRLPLNRLWMECLLSSVIYIFRFIKTQGE